MIIKEHKVGDYAERFRTAKTPIGFAMEYRLGEGRKVCADYVRATKTASIFVGDESIATITFTKDSYANSARSYTAVRHALNGFISIAGKRSRNAANKAKRESEENA